MVWYNITDGYVAKHASLYKYNSKLRDADRMQYSQIKCQLSANTQNITGQ